MSAVGLDGKVKSCRIHDLLREMILNKMEDLSFCRVFPGRGASFIGVTRRISILHCSHDASESLSQISHVRSIFIFDKQEIPYSLLSTLATNFKLLKVLDFDDLLHVQIIFPKVLGIYFT